MRQKPLYPQAVDEATQSLTAELDHRGVVISDPRAVVQAVVRTYLMIARELEQQRIDHRISPLSKRLSQMIVGASIVYEGQSLQVIRQRFKTAQRLMGNPDARWRCESLPDGKVRIERLPDGSRYYRDPAKNPKVRELASLKVGETIVSKTLLTTRGKGQMGSNTKVQARKLMNNPEADWTVKSYNGKVRLTRIK